MLDQFIQQATSQFNVNKENTEKATGGLLKMIQGEIDPSIFSQLAGQFPQVQNYIEQFARSNAGVSDTNQNSSGLFGNLASMAGSMLGGKASTLLTALTMLQQFGFSANQAKDFAAMFGQFVKNNTGETLFTQIVNQVPLLKELS